LCPCGVVTHASYTTPCGESLSLAYFLANLTFSRPRMRWPAPISTAQWLSLGACPRTRCPSASAPSLLGTWVARFWHWCASRVPCFGVGSFAMARWARRGTDTRAVASSALRPRILDLGCLRAPKPADTPAAGAHPSSARRVPVRASARCQASPRGTLSRARWPFEGLSTGLVRPGDRQTGGSSDWGIVRPRDRQTGGSSDWGIVRPGLVRMGARWTGGAVRRANYLLARAVVGRGWCFGVHMGE
jgi:hypothetical protein